jgi:hypothetical protein
MNALAVGASLFIFILLILVVLGVLSPIFSKRFKLKTNLFIVGGYFALVVLLSLITLILPGNALVKGDSIAPTSEDFAGYDTLCTRIAAGNFTPPDSFVKKGVYSFEPQSKSVNISLQSGNVNFVVGTKGKDAPDNGSGKIDVYCYLPKKTTISFNGISINPVMQDTVVSYSDNSLIVNCGKAKSYNYYRFSDGYAARQFFYIDDSLSMDSNSEVIVILLPEGVTTETDQYSHLSDYKGQIIAE